MGLGQLSGPMGTLCLVTAEVLLLGLFWGSAGELRCPGRELGPAPSCWWCTCLAPPLHLETQDPAQSRLGMLLQVSVRKLRLRGGMGPATLCDWQDRDGAGLDPSVAGPKISSFHPLTVRLSSGRLLGDGWG